MTFSKLIQYYKTIAISILTIQLTTGTARLLNVTGNITCVSKLHIQTQCQFYNIKVIQAQAQDSVECRNIRKFILKLYSELNVFNWGGSVFQVEDSEKATLVLNRSISSVYFEHSYTLIKIQLLMQWKNIYFIFPQMTRIDLVRLILLLVCEES